MQSIGRSVAPPGRSRVTTAVLHLHGRRNSGRPADTREYTRRWPPQTQPNSHELLTGHDRAPTILHYTTHVRTYSSAYMSDPWTWCFPRRKKHGTVYFGPLMNSGWLDNWLVTSGSLSSSWKLRIRHMGNAIWRATELEQGAERTK